MKINIAYPEAGNQKYIDVDDEKKLRALYDKRISQEVPGEDLGEEFAGYVFKISGGNDKQGFAMKQGVLLHLSASVRRGDEMDGIILCRLFCPTPTEPMFATAFWVAGVSDHQDFRHLL